MRVAVLGGGIAGLSAAFRLQSAGAFVVLYEAAGRLGGVISTVRRDGFLIEEGPDSFITEKPAAREQIERLGLGDQLIGTRPESRQSFVAAGGRLIPTPEGFYLLGPSDLARFWKSPLLSWPGKARASLEMWLPRRRRPPEDESLGSFVRRRFGQEMLERVAQPMVGGIYGADPEELSLASTFPRFLEMEREHGSVIRALQKRGHTARAASGPRYGLFATLRDGLGRWVEALAGHIGQVRLDTPVTALEPSSNPPDWRVRTARDAEPYDAVIAALPAHAMAMLARGFDPALARELEEIRYGSSVTLSMAFRESALGRPLEGSGFVVPAIEALPLVACTFAHQKFEGRAPVGYALIRAFMSDAALGWDDADAESRALEPLAKLLQLKERPLFSVVSRHPRAMPRYRVGHGAVVRGIEERARTHRGLYLAGAAYHGVGTPDCVASGERAADQALA
ncbi:MAG TPA: protoporphyrinogen oxidase [Candidatus Eisenbacteria bacterium]|nr:protoporphyrinogen oxidase [Candidatus Eisenbacteria bacterium]